MNLKYIFCILLFLLIAMTACNNDDDDAVDFISVEFIGQDGALIQNTSLSISIYGFDNNYQDVSASRITTQNFEAEQIPFILKIKIPNNPSGMIEFLTDAENAQYYLILDWDSNGDGQSPCEGDLWEDYDRNNGTAKLDLTTTTKQTVFLDIFPESSQCN